MCFECALWCFLFVFCSFFVCFLQWTCAFSLDQSTSRTFFIYNFRHFSPFFFLCLFQNDFFSRLFSSLFSSLFPPKRAWRSTFSPFHHVAVSCLFIGQSRLYSLPHITPTWTLRVSLSCCTRHNKETTVNE